MGEHTPGAGGERCHHRRGRRRGGLSQSIVSQHPAIPELVTLSVRILRCTGLIGIAEELTGRVIESALLHEPHKPGGPRLGSGADNSRAPAGNELAIVSQATHVLNGRASYGRRTVRRLRGGRGGSMADRRLGPHLVKVRPGWGLRRARRSFAAEVASAPRLFESVGLTSAHPLHEAVSFAGPGLEISLQVGSVANIQLERLAGGYGLDQAGGDKAERLALLEPDRAWAGELPIHREGVGEPIGFNQASQRGNAVLGVVGRPHNP